MGGLVSVELGGCRKRGDEGEGRGHDKRKTGVEREKGVTSEKDVETWRGLSQWGGNGDKGCGEG